MIRCTSLKEPHISSKAKKPRNSGFFHCIRSKKPISLIVIFHFSFYFQMRYTLELFKIINSEKSTDCSQETLVVNRVVHQPGLFLSCSWTPCSLGLVHLLLLLQRIYGLQGVSLAKHRFQQVLNSLYLAHLLLLLGFVVDSVVHWASIKMGLEHPVVFGPFTFVCC